MFLLTSSLLIRGFESVLDDSSVDLADYGDKDEEEVSSIIKLFRSHWKQKWANEYKERLCEYKNYEKRMIHLRKHLSVLKSMVSKAKERPNVDLKQDLHGLKILTDNRVNAPIDLSRLKSKTVDPKTFMPDIPNTMLDGGVQLPDDMKDIISMQVPTKSTKAISLKPLFNNSWMSNTASFLKKRVPFSKL